MELEQMLELATIINPNARRMKGKAAFRQRAFLQNYLGIRNNNITQSTDHVRIVCANLIERFSDNPNLQPILWLFSGDGGTHNFMNHHVKELYETYGQEVSPRDFIKQLNANHVNPQSPIKLIPLFQTDSGTVNVYPEVTEMETNYKLIRENLQFVNSTCPELGVFAFKRIYLPIFMLYSKDDPDNIRQLQLVSMYADGTIYNVFDEYYEPKNRGKSPNLRTAAQLTARAAASIGITKGLDSVSNFFNSSNLSRKLYPSRYMDRILEDVECEIKIDGETLPEKSRKFAVVGSIACSLYGLKPFHEMPRRNEKRKVPEYNPGEKEKEEDFYSQIPDLQVMLGDPDPLDIVTALPKVLKGQRTGIPNMRDIVARKIEIEQDRKIKFIADGTRHINGNNIVMEFAYYQPFVVLNERPKDYV